MLKVIRTTAGLTQEELANMIGSTKQYISRLERGERNISQIRKDTMKRLCSALNCAEEELTEATHTEFEYDEEGRLIVDGIWWDPRLENKNIAEISGKFYKMPLFSAFKRNVPVEKQLILTKLKKLSEKASRLPQHSYVLYYNCVPRNGFTVELGRALSSAELADLCKKYNIGEDDITDRFIDAKGKIYGSYAKHYTVVQIRSNSALHIETELKNIGVQADNIAPGRVNIRVE